MVRRARQGKLTTNGEPFALSLSKGELRASI